MRKYTAIFLCIALTFIYIPLFSVTSFASDNTDAEAMLLYNLGVTDFEEISDRDVTRAEFVKYVVSLADIGMISSKKYSFEDVFPSDDCYNYVMIAADFGLVSPSANFRPSDAITLSEASKIIVKLLGYDYLAETSGGYPGGYIATANKLKLFDNSGVSGNTISQSAACAILFNALDTKLMEAVYSAGGVEQYVVSDATILGKFRNISLINGKIDGTAFYAVSKASGLGEGMFSLNGTIHKSGKFDTDSLFGYNVDAYINNNTNTLVSYYITDQNRVTKVFAEDVASVSGNSLTYYDSFGKTKTVSFSSGADIFLNGKLFSFDPLRFVPENGSLTFISSGGTGACDTVIIKSYKTVVVDRIISSDYLITDKHSTANSISLKPSETSLVLKNQDGKAIEFADIQVGDVLCAAISDDGETGEVICVRDSFYGVLDGYDADAAYVDGTEYQLTPALKNKLSGIISIGKQASFKFDIDMRIADIIPMTANDEYIGYITVGKFFENGFSKTLKAKILTTESEIVTYEFAQKFFIDGTPYSDAQTAYNTYKSPDYESIKCALVKYTLDNEGKIKTLNYSGQNGTNAGLYETHKILNTDQYATYSASAKSIRKQIFAENTALVFRVPNPLYSVGSTNEELFTVINVTEMSEEGSTGFNMTGYTTVPDDGISQYILMQKIDDDFSVESVSSDSHPRMVSAIKKVIVNGEEYDALDLCDFASGATPVTVYSENENEFSNAGIRPGDIVRVSLAEGNIVTAFEVVYKQGDKRLSNGTTVLSNSNATIPLMYTRLAYAYDFKGEILETLPLEYKFDAENVSSAIVPKYASLYKVLRYDERLKCVVEASIDEILDYATFADSCTKIITHERYSNPRTLFIVE